MTGVPDKAEESVRSGWGAIFGCGESNDQLACLARRIGVEDVRGATEVVGFGGYRYVEGL